jgi:hypothetical protein
MKLVLMLIGYLGLWSTTFIWAGYAIFQAIKTDLGFFTIAGISLTGLVFQLVISVFILGAGAYMKDSK